MISSGVTGLRRAVMVLGAVCVCAGLTAPAALCQQDQGQNQASDQVLLPAESAAKAKALIAKAIAALGGDAYLNLKDVTAVARVSGFGHSGDLNGFGKEIEYAIPPDKERDENMPKRNIITVFNGDKGWQMDRGGVSPASMTEVATYTENVKKDMDNFLRHRIHEQNMIFRYAGIDIVDYNEAEWVEFVDADNRSFRLAIATGTHLPVRWVVDTRDANTRSRSEETTFYSNYHPISGIQTPYQITTERNGIKTQQVFFDKIDYNTGLSPDLFTKESLDERWVKVAPKKKKGDKDDDSDSKSSKSKN
jgi:hypothetical protein